MENELVSFADHFSFSLCIVSRNASLPSFSFLNSSKQASRLVQMLSMSKVSRTVKTRIGSFEIQMNPKFIKEKWEVQLLSVLKLESYI